MAESVRRRAGRSVWMLVTGWPLAVWLVRALIAALLFIVRLMLASLWLLGLGVWAFIRWDAKQLPKRARRQVLPFLLEGPSQS